MLRNTADRGLFDKEGKNFSGDFQVGERTGYSYMLSKPDGTLLSNAFRPYELRRVPESSAKRKRHILRNRKPKRLIKGPRILLVECDRRLVKNQQNLVRVLNVLA